MKILAHTLLLNLLLTSITALAESRIAVIVNGANTQNISRQDIINIYNDRIIAWNNGDKIGVYNLPTASPVRETFSRNILGTTAMAAAKAEANRHITNSSRNPQLLKRERLVILSVISNKNAIGYARAESVKKRKGIRILFLLD